MNAFLTSMNASSCPDDVSTLQYRDSTPCPQQLGESHLRRLAPPFLSPPTSAHPFPGSFSSEHNILVISSAQKALFLRKAKIFPFSSHSAQVKSSVLQQNCFLFEVSLRDCTGSSCRQGCVLAIFVSWCLARVWHEIDF